MGPALEVLWARRGLLSLAVLLGACVWAVAVRVFSPLMYEVLIHEFDPQFNFRATEVLVERGPEEFRNWFDTRSWYPLGRVVGGTVYPGLMATTATGWWILQRLAMPITVQQACVFTGPAVAPLTTLVLAAFAREVTGGDVGAGLATAWVFATMPSYNSRSHAGLYDNEAVAIFAMVLTFYLFVCAQRRGSLWWGLAAALSYFYMVSAWGGYIFITNLLPLYMLVLWATGRLTDRASVVYCAFVVLGTFLAIQIPFVGFQHIQGGDHLAFFGVFGLLMLREIARFLRGVLPDPKHQRLALGVFSAAFCAAAVVVVGGLALAGRIAPWTGRFYALLNPGWARRNLPIITSVAEHQPAGLLNFARDLHLTIPMAGIGFSVCLQKATAGHIFALMYFLVPLYFTTKMVRLMLVLSPAVGLLAGIGLSTSLSTLSPMAVRGRWPEIAVTLGVVSSRHKRRAASRTCSPVAVAAGCVGIGLIVLLGAIYSGHTIYMGRYAYSNPQVTFDAQGRDGEPKLIDDYRDAFKWLRDNTPEDATVLSWWDYGYQISAFSNRTVIVDNNTWNNTHIATVGKVLASTEEEAYPILRRLGADYVLVIYGGTIGYPSDDIAKFYWISRITSGVFPEVDYRKFTIPTQRGHSILDVNPETGSPAFMESLIYRLSYHGIEGRHNLFDMTRQSRFQAVRPLHYLEEAYSSSHLLVRIYRVKDDPGMPPPQSEAAVPT